jgi:oligopeptide/dipeptide ABC transporter ATP-binding protein
VADDIVIMYAGRPMEKAAVKAAFLEPHHPYTQGLLESIPSYTSRSGRLRPIRGNPPSLLRLAKECPFAPRCPYVQSECRLGPPPLKPVGNSPDHLSACILPPTRVGVPEPVGSSEAGRP